MSILEMNVSEPMMTFRKQQDGIKTEIGVYSQDKAGRNLITDQAVPGIKLA